MSPFEPIFHFMTPAPVAHDRHVGGSDQNSTLWFGVPAIAAGAYHMDTYLRPPARMVDGNGVDACVPAHDEPLV